MTDVNDPDWWVMAIIMSSTLRWLLDLACQVITDHHTIHTHRTQTQTLSVYNG